MSQLPVRRPTSLQRVDPMREFDDLRARMDRLMEDAVREKRRTGVLRRRTRRTGRFDYRVGLPAELDPDAVEATLSGGVLHVALAQAHALTATTYRGQG